VAKRTAAEKAGSVFSLFRSSRFCPQAPSSTSYFARLQVAKRTAADKKGGHLTKRKSDGRLLLRESAMVSDEDKPAFEDISKCAAAPEPQP